MITSMHGLLDCHFFESLLQLLGSFVEHDRLRGICKDLLRHRPVESVAENIWKDLSPADMSIYVLLLWDRLIVVTVTEGTNQGKL